MVLLLIHFTTPVGDKYMYLRSTEVTKGTFKEPSSSALAVKKMRRNKPVQFPR